MDELVQKTSLGPVNVFRKVGCHDLWARAIRQPAGRLLCPLIASAHFWRAKL